MDFRACPQLYRFRAVDRLPEAPSPLAVRGTLVHAVLERLFELPAQARTAEAAVGLVPSAWQALCADDPEAASILGSWSPEQEADWLSSASALLGTYFDLEDPRLVQPVEREVAVETVLGDGLVLRGIVDRLDVSVDGQLRIVDYKTGRAPSPGYEARAMFQLRFYALVIWRSRGVLPGVLRLLYLGDGVVVEYTPDEADLLATERLVVALNDAIQLAHESNDWRPNPGWRCSWCSFTEICPAQPLTTQPTPPTSGALDDECGVATTDGAQS